MVPFGLIAAVVSTVNDHIRQTPDLKDTTTQHTEPKDEGIPERGTEEREQRTVTWCSPLYDEYGDRELRHRNERKSRKTLSRTRSRSPFHNPSLNRHKGTRFSCS